MFDLALAFQLVSVIMEVSKAFEMYDECYCCSLYLIIILIHAGITVVNSLE